ncbi:uncharacterized protein BCR38DRAFT_422539 [Pseudomassariella vexata]|uniref:Uncharacterized protein n=1 Tax=Pseudomassariella vexata TaxID=1141098 RepID=A0A1Y2E5N6_9PEZI|nr:uncharacterized protein BCR38DRAFT_429494 [Pseudomassariella vexata]XP_040718532.1 uncharacterized protein BCR38DRAFT_422539 [Pseudomassariella vexata]ORY66175.1 hypothetical protein BCR38DRAFT_429494 [Pseudomassariella vexata]ORY68245.1 hypothetical protein BCR38DRAFT_422539 [Pseudomassariella vexata]
MQIISIIAVSFAAFATTFAQNATMPGNSTNAACVSGSYGCENPHNGLQNIRVCTDGVWMVAATCNETTECVKDDSTGGVTCQVMDGSENE